MRGGGGCVQGHLPLEQYPGLLQAFVYLPQRCVQGVGVAVAGGGVGGGEGEVIVDGVIMVRGTRLGMFDMGGQCFKGVLVGYLDASL